MDSEGKLYLTRAEDEFLLAQNDLRISTDLNTKEFLGITKEKTFYCSVISHAYYSIFYCAKAYLLTKNIVIKAPEEHKKTYEEFKKFVYSGELNKELLEIYEDAINKAETLLKIFFNEKRKRGLFVYNIKAEANLLHAEESIKRSKKFISLIEGLIENEK